MPIVSTFRRAPKMPAKEHVPEKMVEEETPVEVPEPEVEEDESSC